MAAPLAPRIPWMISDEDLETLMLAGWLGISRGAGQDFDEDWPNEPLPPRLHGTPHLTALTET